MEDSECKQKPSSAAPRNSRRSQDGPKRFQSDNHQMNKREPRKPFTRENDLYITNKTDFNVSSSFVKRPSLNFDLSGTAQEVHWVAELGNSWGVFALHRCRHQSRHKSGPETGKGVGGLSIWSQHVHNWVERWLSSALRCRRLYHPKTAQLLSSHSNLSTTPWTLNSNLKTTRVTRT